MKLSIKIAAARRRLRRMEVDRSFFLKRIEEYSPEQKILAIKGFDRTLEQMKEELKCLRAEDLGQEL
jgi:hypothetical protein